MSNKIELTEQEITLRRLLLDVSNYIAEHCGRRRPELRFTGGWVRDRLLGNTSKDIDIGISSATGFEFGNYMKQYLEDPAHGLPYGDGILGSLAKIEANPEKSKHLETVTTKILGLEIDLVNLRKEQYVDDSRNPTMEFGTAREDALRRDATVNALFYNLTTQEVEDFTERGLDDLRLGVIRTPLGPFQTFKDDPLRVLRCVRFASRLGFSIDPHAEQCMNNPDIQAALRQKISRERVGVEVEKMLNGPRPHLALSLIHRLGLYNTVFTNPSWLTDMYEPDLTHWSQACDQLESLLYGDQEESAKNVRSILLCDKLEEHAEHRSRAWLLCALVPWARVQCLDHGDTKTKNAGPVAASVAREGLKITNRNMTMIKNALVHLDEIIATKDAFCQQSEAASAVKRKQPIISRGTLGMSIRRWGADWRSSVIFALLVESTTVEGTLDLQTTFGGYCRWLTHLKELELLEAHSLKPLVDGKQLMKATGRSGGHWLVPALNVALEWQFRNPGTNDPQGAISEVLSLYSQLPDDASAG